MSNGFNSLRQAIVFTPKLRPQPEHQTVVVKADIQEVLGVIRPGKRYDCPDGHLVSVDGVVYAVTEVITWSSSTVELLVQRARLSDSPIREKAGRPASQPIVESCLSSG